MSSPLIAERSSAPFAQPASRLPARVLRAIEIQRERGEIVVSWVQAAIVTLLATLYLLAPSTSPADSTFRPVPWALGIYGAFTAIRLLRSHQRRMGVTMCVLSVFVDIAVLMITIWSFHIEYGQPSAFYLKAPTFTYIFIFIALRTLSFSPGYVLLAGGTAAVGWIALLGLALAEPGGMHLITRDYVAYMTSARILIGGEVDKVISILVVTGLLAIGAARARRLLESSLAEQATAMQLARFFSPDVAETLVRADELLRPGEGISRESAAMFIDLRGFTPLAASLDPRALIGLLGEYQHIVVPIVQDHSGSIATFLGDGVMVTFGAVRPTQTYAADALRCTDDLIKALSGWAADRRLRGEPAPGVGVGVESGTVTCGAIGGEGRLEYAVIGDPVNRAAKLQNHTKAEGVRALTTAATVELALAQGYVPAGTIKILRDREVAGVPTPVDIAVLANAEGGLSTG